MSTINNYIKFTYTDCFESHDSSFSTWTGYNEDTFELLFRRPNGTFMLYEGIPNRTWESLKDADSVGQGYHMHVIGSRNGTYKGTGVDSFETLSVTSAKKDSPLDIPAPEEIPSDEGKPLGKYVVVGYFDNLEDAMTAYSYTDGKANYTSLSSVDQEVK